MGVRILVLGGGGREHALCARLAADGGLVFCAPGNPGINEVATPIGLEPEDSAAVRGWAKANAVDLVVCGPEAPLAAGVTDAIRSAGIACIGPSRRAARIETSKVFAKRFMHKVGIPTADAEEFDDPQLADAYLAECRYPTVIKADGLAAGKGVTVAADRSAAQAAVNAAMREEAFGLAGSRILIEECLQGPEISAFCLTDGTQLAMLPFARDYKRARDGDQGANTGSMGSYAPAPLVPAGSPLAKMVEDRVFRPAIAALSAAGAPYVGFLYAGLMLTAAGPRVLEFNARLGDPEAQTILGLIEGNLVEACQAAASGQMQPGLLGIRSGAAVCIVAASGGYPAAYPTGLPISLDQDVLSAPGIDLFHAGTGRCGMELITAGGRVLGIVGSGENFAQARERAYLGLSGVKFANLHFRSDIAAEAADGQMKEFATA